MVLRSRTKLSAVRKIATIFSNLILAAKQIEKNSDAAHEKVLKYPEAPGHA